MGLFDGPKEEERKRNLHAFEDKRLRFAEKMQKEGFAPARMMMMSTEEGGFYALCRCEGALYLIVSPVFGGEGEIERICCDGADIHREEFFEAAEGMGGAFGFGKKGAKGFYLVIEKDGQRWRVPMIVNKNSASEYAAKNPLLSTKRRRGDANLVWDLRPLDKPGMEKMTRALERILEG